MRYIGCSLILILIAALPLFPRQHDHGQMTAADGQFNPSVIDDGHDGFYLAFVERRNGRSDIMLRHSADGKTFSDAVRVNDIPGDAVVRNENPPKLAIAPNGDLYICWANESGKWKGNIHFARSTDNGKSFSRTLTLNSDADLGPVGHAFQSVAVDKKGVVYVAWIDERDKASDDRGAEIWMVTSNDGGRSFSHDRKVLSDVCECCRTNLQTDGEGRLFLSYRTVPATGPMFRDIILARSSDGGRHFEQTVVSHNGWELNAWPVVGATVTTNLNGKITVVWFTGGKETGLYYATSVDHGISFSSRSPLDPAHSLAKHAQTVATAGDNVLVAFDITGEKPESVWAMLNMQTGKMSSYGKAQNISYPSIATNGRVAVVSGMQPGNLEIYLQVFEVKDTAATPKAN